MIGCTKEPDGSYSWEVYNPRKGERLQTSIADTWDDARLDMIENLYSPSDESDDSA